MSHTHYGMPPSDSCTFIRVAINVAGHVHGAMAQLFLRPAGVTVQFISAEPPADRSVWSRVF